MLPSWLKNRASGVHLHPSSLPGGYGIGNLGRFAYEWIDFYLRLVLGTGRCVQLVRLDMETLHTKYFHPLQETHIS